MSNGCELSIIDFRLWVHLGCSAEERFNPQPVSINIKFSFPSPPAGIYTDSIADSYCYTKALNAIKMLLTKKSFKIIEHLTASIYEVVGRSLHDNSYHDVELNITVTKISPPVADVLGGISFSYSGTGRQESKK